MDGRPFLHPRVRSIVAPGGRMVPARSHGVRNVTSELIESEPAVAIWSPWLHCSPDFRGPLQSSGPLAGLPTRHGLGTAYMTPLSGWGLSGVATGWSRPGAPTPAQQPTTRLAIGRGWRPFGAQGANAAPLPSLPEPARMVAPRLR